MGRSVACQGTATIIPLLQRISTQGTPPRQKTRHTRPAWPQCGWLCAITVRAAPRSAT